jgi:membrane-bound ClpP family serine protease
MQPVINHQYHKCKGHIETGVVFIVLGVVLLFMKLDVIQLEWHWYVFAAIAFVTMGTVEFVQFKRPHKIFEGLSKIALGAWFYIAFSGLWGVTPANSWPLILIITGAGLVFKSLFKTKSSNRVEEE